jgi:hypothetical protein
VTVTVLPPWIPSELPSVDVTSGGTRWAGLSPFLLGPVPLYDLRESATMENAWQYAKVYAQHARPDGGPSSAYWDWAHAGWASSRAVRYPMGKGARPLYCLWAGEQLGYLQARRRVYLPLYAQAVRFRALPQLRALRELAAAGDLVIRDYDAYDHRALGYSWEDVLNDPDRTMGHGLVLAMMIEGVA